MNKQESDSKNESLALDISLSAIKIFSFDSPRMKKLKQAIKGIYEALRSDHTDRILFENIKVCSEFPEIIFAPLSGITRVSGYFLMEQPRHIQRESLKLIGYVLYDAVISGKLIEAAKEGGKIVCQKGLENICGFMSEN